LGRYCGDVVMGDEMTAANGVDHWWGWLERLIFTNNELRWKREELTG
jgi:hypothetical protein